MDPPSSRSGAVNSAIIEGPYRSFQRRTAPTGEFTQTDRLWRKQYLQDQVLSSKDLASQELDFHPEYRKARFNIFRRIFRIPGDRLEMGLQGLMSSPEAAKLGRVAITRVMALWAIGVGVSYFVMFNESNWERQGGMKIMTERHAIYPGHPEWPHNTSQKRNQPSDYNNQGFKYSTI